MAVYHLLCAGLNYQLIKGIVEILLLYYGDLVSAI